jgi:hypothetical protein
MCWECDVNYLAQVTQPWVVETQFEVRTFTELQMSDDISPAHVHLR